MRLQIKISNRNSPSSINISLNNKNLLQTQGSTVCTDYHSSRLSGDGQRRTSSEFHDLVMSVDVKVF